MKSLSKIKKIYGPPGTGKTTYLLKIVEEEIARKVLPNEIAFLAYTKKSCYRGNQQSKSKV